MFDTIKCKKCRHILLDSGECRALLIDAHNTTAANTEINELCPTVVEQNLLFLSEGTLPEWILSSIEEGHWAKGKLNCKQCDARIGAFDFISGIKCACDGSVLPAVYIIRSKVDAIRTICL